MRLRDQIGTALTGDHTFRRINPAAGVTISTPVERESVRQLRTVVARADARRTDLCAILRIPAGCRTRSCRIRRSRRSWRVRGKRVRAGMLRGVNWTVSGFRTAAADDIIFVSSGTLRGEGHFENVERTWRKGVEASLEVTHWRIALSAFATYTVQQAAFGADLRIASQFHPLAQNGEILVRRAIGCRACRRTAPSLV